MLPSYLLSRMTLVFPSHDNKHKIVFSRPARNFDAEGKPVAIEAISDIKNGMKDTRSLMSKLFGYDPQ